MNFMESAKYEFDYALRKSPFDKWADKVEKIVGHDLDGDQEQDGYSLDVALIRFEAGVSAEDYAKEVSQATR